MRVSAALERVRLRARIAAGRIYAASFVAVARALQRIPRESWLGRQKRAIADRFRPRPKKKVRMLYATFARIHPTATFVQIGANDGVMDDPLREFVLASRWRGVLVEPVPYLFERLRQNYSARPGLAFANVAIATQSGRMPFYYLRESSNDAGVPDWHVGLGSFSRDVVLKHADVIPDIESRLVAQEVACCTFDDLCREHGIERLDVLHIDTEGYDFEILKTVDFGKYRPRLVVYERHHLNEATRQACRQYMRSHGYEGIEEGLDAICINIRDLTPVDAPVYAAWQVLRDTAGYIRA